MVVIGTKMMMRQVAHHRARYFFTSPSDKPEMWTTPAACCVTSTARKANTPGTEGGEEYEGIGKKKSKANKETT